MTEYLTTTQSALAPSSPVAEWHAHLDLQVRAGQMAKDTATTYRQGMRKLTEWAAQQESWNRTLILEWIAALKERHPIGVSDDPRPRMEKACERLSEPL